MDNVPLWSNDRSLAEMLGYEKTQKLLVVNCDDVAIHPALTDGAIGVLKKGLVRSASITVTDRNDIELERIARIIKENQDWGFGIHLSLNNEWQESYPWAPVLSKREAPTLYNEKGLAWQSSADVKFKVNPEEAEREWEAQILKAKRFGIPLTHIDSHMGTYFFESKYPGSDPDGFRNVALRIAKKYNLPVVMNTYDRSLEKTMRYMDQNKMIRPEMFIGFYDFGSINKYMAYQGSSFRREIVALFVKLKFGLQLPFRDFYSVEEDMRQRMKLYKQIILNEVRPGLNHILIHPAVETAYNGRKFTEITNRKRGLDKIIRLSERKVWSSKVMKKFLERQNIIVINYKKLQEIQKISTRRWRK